MNVLRTVAAAIAIGSPLPHSGSITPRQEHRGRETEAEPGGAGSSYEWHTRSVGGLAGCRQLAVAGERRSSPQSAVSPVRDEFEGRPALPARDPRRHE